MSKSLEDRLKTHSSAFDSLLSLIPARYYYDENSENQWKAKKKSKDELKANKKAKLDPSNIEIENSSASDILREREKFAKPVVIPGSKGNGIAVQDDKEQQEEEEEEEEEAGYNSSELEEEEEEENFIKSDHEGITMVFDDEGNEIEKQDESEISTLVSTSTSSSNGSSSKKAKKLSDEEEKLKREKLAKLKEKLSMKISLLKEKRKALGTKVPGAPQSREEILEQRRQKEESKKRKHEEDEKDEEEDDIDDEDQSSEDEEYVNEGGSMLFQNIVFEDGDRITSDLSSLRKKPTKKGPSNNDIRAHLQKLQKEKEKLSQMSDEEKAKFLEKAKWNKAMLNVEGVKLKDNEHLLKKSLRRKEQKKRKSEREWKERKEDVQATVQARQKRREENLQLRKENKGKKGKKQQAMKRKFTGTISKNGKKKQNQIGGSKNGDKRAGFEGGRSRKAGKR